MARNPVEESDRQTRVDSLCENSRRRSQRVRYEYLSHKENCGRWRRLALRPYKWRVRFQGLCRYPGDDGVRSIDGRIPTGDRTIFTNEDESSGSRYSILGHIER